MSKGPECKGCESVLECQGSFWLCGDRECNRYAIPVNDEGLTREEMSSRSRAWDRQHDAAIPLEPSA